MDRTLLTRALLVIAILVSSFSVAEPADATFADGDGLVTLDEIEAAVLLFKTDRPGYYVPAPALHTDIDLEVSGPVVRATVSQRFHNVADVFVEGKYVFPLPEGSAVDTLRMRVGDRWIEGSIEEREEARLIYEQARDAGQVASLIEQERPNVFTTSVANIAPDAEIIVQIQYQQTLAPRDGVFGLRVPLVVAPRYTPADQGLRLLALGPNGWAGASGGAPVADSRLDDPTTVRNPVEINIDLNAGFPLGQVKSAYHDIDVERRFENDADITLTSAVAADRDFYLSWHPDPLAEPYAATFTESRNGDTHYVAMLTPPSVDAIEANRQPREVIFVQDTSGSMEGDSIVQAKAGLILALERLDRSDYFNIIEFNSFYSMFAFEPVRATRTNIDKAIEWVEDLIATNGTEMLPALEYALADDDTEDRRLRQVVFLTDGAVSNETQMLNLIESDLGDSRLFTVGIGSAPNSYFMTAAAQAGRGSFVFIGDLAEVTDQMQVLFAKIESPAVVNLAVEGLAANAEVSPFPIPDLYAGDPIVLTVRVPSGAEIDQMRLVGQRGVDNWQLDLTLDDAMPRAGVSKLWAREHIRKLEALRVSPEVGQDERESIDDSVLETALEFQLVSRLTSLVAVDVEVTRPPGDDSASTDVARNLPNGWDPDIFFDEVTDLGEAALSGDALDRLSAAQGQREAAAEAGVDFAATGGDWQIRTVLGAALIAVGVVAMMTSRNRRRRESCLLV